MYRFSIALNAQNDKTYGIQNIELTDGCFGAPLWELDGNRLEDIRNDLILNMRRIVLYSTDLPVSEYEHYILFFRKAHLLNIENVHLTYAAMDGADDDSIRKIIVLGEAFSIRIVFLYEYAHLDAFGVERYAALRSENTGLIFDTCEFVPKRINAYRQMLHTYRYRNDVLFLRVHDVLFDTLEPKLPLHGNSEIKDAASGLLARGFKGYFSFIPYGNFPMQDIIQAFCALLCNM